jgi:hypothetical protein
MTEKRLQQGLRPVEMRMMKNDMIKKRSRLSDVGYKKRSQERSKKMF